MYIYCLNTIKVYILIGILYRYRKQVTCNVYCSFYSLIYYSIYGNKKVNTRHMLQSYFICYSIYNTEVMYLQSEQGGSNLGKNAFDTRCNQTLILACVRWGKIFYGHDKYARVLQAF